MRLGLLLTALETDIFKYMAIATYKARVYSFFTTYIQILAEIHDRLGWLGLDVAPHEQANALYEAVGCFGGGLRVSNKIECR